MSKLTRTERQSLKTEFVEFLCLMGILAIILLW